MMQPFLLTDSETVILGRCLELYLQRRQDFGSRPAPPTLEEIESAREAEEATGSSQRFFSHVQQLEWNRKTWEKWNSERQSILFLSFLKTEFSRFFPTRPASEIETPSEVPFDVEWVSRADLEIGFSSDDPAALYCEVAGAMLRVVRHRHEKTTDVLVSEWLGDEIAKSLFDHIAYASDEDWAKMQFEAEKKAGEQHFFPPRVGDDNPEAIANRLEALASDPLNDQRELLACGRLFGKIESDCRRYLQGAMQRLDDTFNDHGGTNITLPDWFEMDAEPTLERSEWLTQLIETVNELIEGPQFPQGGLARLELLRRIDALKQNAERLTDEDDCCALLEVLDVEALRNSLMFALGELSGRRWDPDMTRLQEDALMRDPRFMRLSPTSTVDRVRGQLEMVDSSFRQGYSPHLSPANVVSAVSPAIEALTRRCWPDDFIDGGRRASVSDVLHARSRTGAEKEVRFASLALNLYRHFRNQSQHDLDNADVSWPEALYFRTGIRVLLELSDAICATK